MNRRLSNYTTRDIVVVDWMQEMADAFGIMKAKGVNHLPVVDDKGAIVGILSDRDFQRVTPLAQAEGFARVRDFMSWPVEAIAESSTISDTARTMIEKKVSSLVVTRGQAVVGIVTSEDLLRAFLNSSEGVVGELKDGMRSMMAGAVSSPVAPTIGEIAHQLANIGI